MRVVLEAERAIVLTPIAPIEATVTIGGFEKHRVSVNDSGDRPSIAFAEYDVTTLVGIAGRVTGTKNVEQAIGQ